MSGVVWMTWRCRLDSETMSSSTAPSVPTPEAAGADHQHGRLFQRGLPRATDFVQHDMAGVTFEFVGRQHGRVLPSLANPHGEERGTRVSNHEAPISPRGHPSRRPLRGLLRMRTSINLLNRGAVGAD